MAKFKVTSPDGKIETIEQSDCKTVEQFINCRYGRNAKTKDKVELVKKAASTEPKK